jgi:hypothetical protein
MIAARSLLHGEHWAGTKKSTSAADAEKCFYLLSVRFYQLPSGLLYTSTLPDLSGQSLPDLTGWPGGLLGFRPHDAIP